MAAATAPPYDAPVVVIQRIQDWRFPRPAQRLDSAMGTGSPWSRWSYRPGPALMTLRCDSRTGHATLSRGGRVVEEWADPLEALRSLSFRTPSMPQEGPPFKGGWIGFLSYDLGRYFERLPMLASDDLHVPLFHFTYHASVDAQDESGQIYAIDVKDPQAPPVEDGVETFATVTSRQPSAPSQPVCNFTPAGYRAVVARVIDYIRAGDVFQVNLSQRFSVALAPRAAPDIYQKLLTLYPAWHGAFLQMDDLALLCNSPELFLKITPGPHGREIVTRPIKGTRPRSPGMLQRLRDSEKDQAELNMIVDLERNDLGRICRTGTVRVTEPRTIEAHPTVYHGAATIGGMLRDDVDFIDVLAATFPGGSVTGAPKIRAMEIIEELEPVRRGAYCGAIGYISCDGNVQFNVAIRTMTLDASGQIHIPVGGGIVADSDPEEEYRETLVKARAMFAALGLKPPGDDAGQKSA